MSYPYHRRYLQPHHSQATLRHAALVLHVRIHTTPHLSHSHSTKLLRLCLCLARSCGGLRWYKFRYHLEMNCKETKCTELTLSGGLMAVTSCTKCSPLEATMLGCKVDRDWLVTIRASRLKLRISNFTRPSNTVGQT